MKTNLKIASTATVATKDIRQIRYKVTGILFILVSTLTIDLAHADTRNILIVGDSLSAAYGMSVKDGWAAKLQHRLDGTRHELEVVNASVSGDTSANGLTKLPALLTQYNPEYVIIELGGNDGLRGMSVKKLKQNLKQMTELAQAKDATVIILGMMIPSNYGAAYTRMFTSAFADVAAEANALLVPFFLQGLETGLDWFQNDGIHPNEKAQNILLDNVWEVLAPEFAGATH